MSKVELALKLVQPHSNAVSFQLIMGEDLNYQGVLLSITSNKVNVIWVGNERVTL